MLRECARNGVLVLRGMNFQDWSLEGSLSAAVN